MKFLASLALGIALGVVAALFLVFWRSGAEPDEPAVTERRLAIARRQLGYLLEPDGYDGEAVGVG